MASSCLRALQYYLIPFCETEYIHLFYPNNLHRKKLIIVMLQNKFTEYSRVVPPYWIVFRNIDMTKSPFSIYSPVSTSLRAMYVSSFLFRRYPYWRISMFIAPSSINEIRLRFTNQHMQDNYKISLSIEIFLSLTARYSYDSIISVYCSIIHSFFLFACWVVPTTYSAPIFNQNKIGVWNKFEVYEQW